MAQVQQKRTDFWLLSLVQPALHASAPFAKGIGKAGGNCQRYSIKQAEELPWIYVISCKDSLKSFECQLRSGACLPYGVFLPATPALGEEE